jgi:hypothetical protein
LRAPQLALLDFPKWVISGRYTTAGIYDGGMGPTVILRGNNPGDRMSALGQKQTLGKVRLMSALPPKADID